MTDLVVGVDGGGSKTRVIVADASGEALADVTGPGSAMEPELDAHTRIGRLGRRSRIWSWRMRSRSKATARLRSQMHSDSDPASFSYREQDRLRMGADHRACLRAPAAGVPLSVTKAVARGSGARRSRSLRPRPTEENLRRR